MRYWPLRRLWDALVVIGCVLLLAAAAHGQSSSLYHRRARADSAAAHAPSDALSAQRAPESNSSNPVLDRTSLIAVELADPREFHVHDIITIIVQESKIYESEADTESKRRFDFQSELQEWFRFSECKLVAETFPNGFPNVDYTLNNRVKNEGEVEREDTLVTRIAAEVIDVKPNGNLVLEARHHIGHDEEEIIASLTGVCRSKDVSPDNTILSSKVADFDFTATHSGAVRDAARRGWVTRLLDFLRPI
jgi:flagellar basal body L-ring protein FlgH